MFFFFEQTKLDLILNFSPIHFLYTLDCKHVVTIILESQLPYKVIVRKLPVKLLGLIGYGLCCSGDDVFAIECIQSDAKIVGIGPLNFPTFSVVGVSPLRSLMLP